MAYRSKKKYNIYYVYNYILPQYPLKIADFWKSMFWAVGQYVAEIHS